MIDNYRVIELTISSWCAPEFTVGNVLTMTETVRTSTFRFLRTGKYAYVRNGQYKVTEILHPPQSSIADYKVQRIPPSFFRRLVEWF